ncbi:MAG: hypothetical protein LBD41_04245 [Clostridiales Family XIII bacterium]|jgi:hypothetical protein|nr:hypothetical protein [Clostridiales Family XIII bacterium]
MKGKEMIEEKKYEKLSRFDSEELLEYLTGGRRSIESLVCAFIALEEKGNLDEETRKKIANLKKKFFEIVWFYGGLR